MKSMTSLNQLDDDFARSFKKFVEVVFDPDFKSRTVSEEAFKNLVNILEKRDFDYGVPYHHIAQVVFGLSTTDGIDTFKREFYDLMDEYYKKSDHKDSVYKQLKKIVSHTELAVIQKDSLLQAQLDQIKELGNGLDGLNFAYKEMQEKLKSDIQKSADRFDARIDTMYNSFISVLGIFIAISFSLFGAATLLKNIFTIATTNGFDVSAKVVGTNISLAGFSTILIYLLVIGLVQGISSVTNKSYFFSLRKLFVVIGVAGGVVLSGYAYGHTTPSWEHIIITSGLLSIYVILWSVIYHRIPWIKKKLIG